MSESYRDFFFIPKDKNGEPVAYLCGNSLGLQPKSVQAFLKQELEDWAMLGVEGHFRAKNPWLDYHKLLTQPMASLVGAKPHEVVVMNTLTVNLHLLLATFYKPKGKKFKILTEAQAFSSDYYVIESQAQWHGYDPQAAILEVCADNGTEHILTGSFVEAIEKNHEEIALVLFGGVNFYTGQFFDLEKITACAHQFGIPVGIDLAHAAGNVELCLHDWKVDFAAWCSYKYLNAGPGGPSGLFIHEEHSLNPNTFRLAGWWGNDASTRFKMEKGFVPQIGAEGWQLSNAQIMSMAPLLASMEIFSKAGMPWILKKRKELSEVLWDGLNLLKVKYRNRFSIITPENPKEHGCQVSISIPDKAKEVCQYLQEMGIVSDFRQPDVLRVAPVPLYNEINDVKRFLAGFEKWISNSS